MSAPRFRFSEITTWLVMLAGLGWLLGWAYVGAASHEPERSVAPAPQLCPSVDECWKTCFHASIIALESCIDHADYVCDEEHHKECYDDLEASDERYWALQDDYQDHCDAMIQAMFHEMFWEDRSNDEWEDSATEGASDGERNEEERSGAGGPQEASRQEEAHDEEVEAQRSSSPTR